MSALIEVDAVDKVYQTPSGQVAALQGVSLSLARGKMVAITGKSGSGKSTLLNVIAGIDRVTAGLVIVGGVGIHALDEGQLARWRGRNVGFVFQFFQLLPTLTVAENVVLPMDFCDTYPRQEREGRARELLRRVGIEEQADKLPATLSGGQQQRAAIARALANEPPILVADEPTGNLDSVTTAAIFELFTELARAGTTVLVVTHEKELAGLFEEVLTIVDGRLMGSR